MTSIELTCTGNAARAEIVGTLATGTIGIEVRVNLDETFDGLTPKMIIRCGQISKVGYINAQGIAEIPHECLIPGAVLYLGVDGFDAHGVRRVPTVPAYVGRVERSAADDHIEIVPPTPEIVEQIWDAAYQAEKNSHDAVVTADQAAAAANSAVSMATGLRDSAKSSAEEAANWAVDARNSRDRAAASEQAALAAQESVLSAKGVVIGLRDETSGMAMTASGAASQAVGANVAAQSAKTAAEAAADDALGHKGAAEAAKTAALQAQEQAAREAVKAASASTGASEYAAAASRSAGRAEDYALTAAGEAVDAAESAGAAEAAKTAVEGIRDRMTEEYPLVPGLAQRVGLLDDAVFTYTDKSASATWTIGTIKSTGELTSSTTRIRIAAFSVPKGTKIFADDGYKIGIHRYTSTTIDSWVEYASKITESKTEPTPYIVPEDCYVRIFMGANDDSTLTDTSISSHAHIMTVTGYRYDEHIPSKADRTDVMAIAKDLFTDAIPLTYRSDRYLDSGTGTVVNNSSYPYTFAMDSYISIDEPVLISVDSGYQYRVYRYDANKAFLSAGTYTNEAYTIMHPSDEVAYIRVNVRPRGSTVVDYAGCKAAFHASKYRPGASGDDFASKKSVDDILSGDIMPKSSAVQDKSGIVFTPLNDGRYIVSGTTIEGVNYNLFAARREFPAGFEKGARYYLDYADTSGTQQLRVMMYYYSTSGAEIEFVRAVSSCFFEIPEEAEGLIIRFRINPKNTEIGSVIVYPRVYRVDSIGYLRNLAEPGKLPPMLTLIDDDGCKRFYTDVLPIIQSKNVPIASAVVSTQIAEREAGTSSFWMNWAEIEECHINGTEILSHTYNHASKEEYELMSERQIERMLRMSRHELLHHGIDSPLMVYSGYSASVPQMQIAASRVFDGAFLAGGEVDNMPGDFDRYNINRYGLGLGNLDYLKGLIDQLVTNKTGWQVWMFHTSSTSWSDTWRDNLAAVVDYCFEQGIPIVTAAYGSKMYAGISSYRYP